MYLIKNVHYNIISKTVDEKTNDALILWLNKNPRQPFCKETAGAYQAMGKTAYKRLIESEGFSVGDVYTFTPGYLDYDVLFNCVCDDREKTWDVIFYNLGKVMEEYKRTNKLNTITIYFPKFDVSLIQRAMDCFQSIGLKKVNILSTDEGLLRDLKNYFYYKDENKLFGKIISRIINFIGKKKI